MGGFFFLVGVLVCFSFTAFGGFGWFIRVMGRGTFIIVWVFEDLVVGGVMGVFYGFGFGLGCGV